LAKDCGIANVNIGQKAGIGVAVADKKNSGGQNPGSDAWHAYCFVRPILSTICGNFL